jgi:hypothetical protein
MHLHQRMSQSLLHLLKRLHTHAATSTQTNQKPNQAACGVGSLDCSAATPKKKPNQLWAIKSQANAASAVMAAAPMAEAAVVAAVAVVVTVPNAVSAQKVKVATNATPKALRPVASVQHVASAVKAVAAHAKTATAVDAAKVAMLKAVTQKAKRPSTTTPHLKLKPKPAPKHATNAWPAKSAEKTPKAATINASLAANVVIVQSVVKAAKAVANAAHAASATKVAVNALLA